MKIKIDAWYTHKDHQTHFPIKVIDVLPPNANGRILVKYVESIYCSCHIYLMELSSFERQYQEYLGNFSEYTTDELIRVVKGLAEETSRYVKICDSTQIEFEKTRNEISALKRENKILNVLAFGKRQKEWIEGKVIPGRVAECTYCHSMVLSETTLPFFKERPECDTDEYYDGCRGWD